ncbi:hypothetical protein [Sandaracinus amylolyticus]|uniref:hypothetical protein n=1 Tax=Sandaracinus amylolyticus TaxID=927083 RepID=UPI001F3FD5B0|nr:hypothetical protein [Sandaracinus amylolyticus]UJR82105.1 Hypothetical protein I5071_41700 [Sandaracinus amylolyticus]
MSWILRWLAAFALTQCVEMGVYVQAHDAPRPLRERVAIAFACSGITHPLVWFVLLEVLGELGVRAYWGQVAITEGIVVLVEAAFLACFGVRRALLWALAANALSVLFGFFCYTRLAW